jgi:plasmid maintenance system antidote protein VapI
MDHSKFNPDWKIHPGATVRELFLCKILNGTDLNIEEKGEFITQLDEIFREKGSITPKIASLLSQLFGVSETLFLNLQKSYDSDNP